MKWAKKEQWKVPRNRLQILEAKPIVNLCKVLIRETRMSQM